ncbi:MAG: PAS domain-containing protein [bacterium]|nr:PAS domain-containing protein [bacterium]
MFFCDRAKEIRKTKKIKLKDMAVLMSVSEMTINRWENGSYTPSANDIRVMSAILEVPLNIISDLSEINLFNKTISITKNSQLKFSSDIYKLDKSLDNYNDIPDELLVSIKSLTNISKSYQQTNALLKNENQRYKHIFNISSNIIFVVDANLKFRLVNEAFILMANKLNSENIIGCKATDIFGVQEVADIIKYEHEVLKTEKPIRDIKINIPLTNKQKVGLLSIEPQVDEFGKVYELICSIKDITELSKSVTKLQNIKTMLDLSDDIFFLMDDNNEFEYISESFKDFTGFSKEEYIANPDIWKQYTHLEDYSKRKALIELLPDQKVEYQSRILHKNGPERWVEVRGYHKYDRQKNTHIRYKIIRDVTDKVRQEKILDLILKGINKSPFSIWISDYKRKKFLFVSDSIKKIYGFPASKFYESLKFWVSRLHPDDLEKIKKTRKEGILPPMRNYKIITADNQIKQILEINTLLDDMAMGIEIDKTNELESYKEGLSRIKSAYSNNETNGIAIKDIKLKRFIYVNSWIQEMSQISNSKNITKLTRINISNKFIKSEHDKNLVKDFDNHKIHRIQIKITDKNSKKKYSIYR